MKKLAVVRGPHLNPWDCSNYYGVITDDVELYLCGQGADIDWNTIMTMCPRAIPFAYNRDWEVFNIEPDVIDVPDAHYGFSQYYVHRFNRVAISTWDNLPGKNSFDMNARAALRCWKTLARSTLAAATLKYDGVPQEKIRVIPGAVDIEFFRPPDDESNRFDNIILFVGRLTLEKGLLDLIWAMEGLPAELWIVGEGNFDYFLPWLESKRVNYRYLGSQTRGQLADLYRQATVFCVPSIPKLDPDPYGVWLEQFGQVFIEAMSSGLPIVSSNSGAIPEVVGLGGDLVNSRDFLSLRRRINDLLIDRNYWQAVSNAARSRAIALFSQEVVGEMIRDWYELE